MAKKSMVSLANTAQHPAALNERQSALQKKLIERIDAAIPAQQALEDALQRVEGCYQSIAELLVELRHEFKGPNGEPYDLKGRSVGYRLAVREAYGAAGARASRPIPKRLTAGVAYWVRKILIDRYGESGLYELGIVKAIDNIAQRPVNSRRWQLPDDPERCLLAVVGLLNELATDPRVVPTKELVRSAIRAVHLLQAKLDSENGAEPAVVNVVREPLKQAVMG